MPKLKSIVILININNEMPKSNIKFIPFQNKSVIVHMCFVLFIVCLYICVSECSLRLQNNNHKTKHKNNTNSGSVVFNFYNSIFRIDNYIPDNWGCSDPDFKQKQTEKETGFWPLTLKVWTFVTFVKVTKSEKFQICVLCHKLWIFPIFVNKTNLVKFDHKFHKWSHIQMWLVQTCFCFCFQGNGSE